MDWNRRGGGISRRGRCRGGHEFAGDRSRASCLNEEPPSLPPAGRSSGRCETSRRISASKRSSCTGEITRWDPKERKKERENKQIIRNREKKQKETERTWVGLLRILVENKGLTFHNGRGHKVLQQATSGSKRSVFLGDKILLFFYKLMVLDL